MREQVNKTSNDKTAGPRPEHRPRPVLGASVSGTVASQQSRGAVADLLQLREPAGQSRPPCLRSQSQCRGGRQADAASAPCFTLVPGDVPLACRGLAAGLWVGSPSLALARPPPARDPRQGLPLRRLQRPRRSRANCTVVPGVRRCRPARLPPALTSVSRTCVRVRSQRPAHVSDLRFQSPGGH